jgi:hypothetical protein
MGIISGDFDATDQLLIIHIDISYRSTDITKLIVAFRNFENAPKKKTYRYAEYMRYYLPLLRRAIYVPNFLLYSLNRLLLSSDGTVVKTNSYKH